MFKRREQHISKSLIQQHLVDSDSEDDIEQDPFLGDAFSSEISRPESRSYSLPRCPSIGDLLGYRAWFDQLCELELAENQKSGNLDSSWSSNCRKEIASQESNTHHNSETKDLSLNLAVLQRIREGQGPRDVYREDLLAPLRNGQPANSSPESFAELKKVLLEWNKRVAGQTSNDQDAKEMLRIAIENRIELLRSPIYDVDKAQILEESATELQHALTALRPEIRGFESQDPFDILVTMWANERVAIPGMDDDLKLMTMKALLHEVESKLYATNAGKLSGMARSLSVAKLELDLAEVERLEAKMQAFKEKMRETAAKRLIDKIRVARSELMQMKLEELQVLTELQAAQKWAAHARMSITDSWQEQNSACDQSDRRLQWALQQQVPELNAHIHVVQTNATALADMSSSLLSRALKAGFSLKDESTQTLAGLEKSDLQTYLTGSITDILYAREEAAKMLDRMGTVESYLDVLLQAAKSQYQGYDGLLRVLNPSGSLSTVGDAEVDLAERYGPRRESIVLMARDMQRSSMDAQAQSCIGNRQVGGCRREVGGREEY